MPSETRSFRPASRTATLFDGVSARDHTVAVTVDIDCLVLEPLNRGEPPRCPLIWPLAESRAASSGRADRLTVTTSGAADARLVIEDPTLRATVMPLLSRSGSHSPATRAALRWAAGLGLAVLLIVALAGLATRYAAQILPATWGARLADDMLEQLSRTYPVCTGASGNAALDRLAGRMAATLDLPPPRVVTVRWDLVNAFALPGGRVVLTSGFIARTNRPEAVAAVLAHEIGHVARRDPLARLLRGKLIDVTLSAVFGVSVGIGGTGAVVGFLLDSGYTREQEDGADAVAIGILNDLDIDAGPAAGFFDALAAEETGIGAIALLRTHPLSSDRAATLRRRGTGAGPGLTQDEWQSVAAMCN
jgi:Zn-dependent protease with chaperone function